MCLYRLIKSLPLKLDYTEAGQGAPQSRTHSNVVGPLLQELRKARVSFQERRPGFLHLGTMPHPLIALRKVAVCQSEPVVPVGWKFLDQRFVDPNRGLRGGFGFSFTMPPLPCQ